MSKIFVSQILTGEDSNPLIFNSFDELSKGVNLEDWQRPIENADRDEIFTNGRIFKVLGFAPIEGNVTDTESGKQPDVFRYIAVALEPIDAPKTIEVYSCKALRRKHYEFSSGTAKIVEKPNNALTKKDFEKLVGNNVKCVAIPYYGRDRQGNFGDFTDISFVEA